MQRNKTNSYRNLILSVTAFMMMLLAIPSFAMIETQSAYTPAELLHVAIKEGDIECVTKLLESGFNPNQAFADGVTPLHMAVIHNQEQIAVLLLQNGANVKSKETATNATPLHFAALYGRASIAKLLIDKGAIVNEPMKFDITPLLVAAQFKQPELIELLLKHKADINHTDQEGFTALHLSAQNNDEISALMLIKNGAAVNAKDKSQETPLKIASTKNYIGMMNLLKEHGAVDVEDATPSQPAVKNESN